MNDSDHKANALLTRSNESPNLSGPHNRWYQEILSAVRSASGVDLPCARSSGGAASRGGLDRVNGRERKEQPTPLLQVIGFPLDDPLAEMPW
jgi:hypothetical protein